SILLLPRPPGAQAPYPDTLLGGGVRAQPFGEQASSRGRRRTSRRRPASLPAETSSGRRSSLRVGHARGIPSAGAAEARGDGAAGLLAQPAGGVGLGQRFRLASEMVEGAGELEVGAGVAGMALEILPPERRDALQLAGVHERVVEP